MDLIVDIVILRVLVSGMKSSEDKCCLSSGVA